MIYSLVMHEGIYFLNTSSLETVKRFLSGLYANFRTYNLADIQTYFYNNAVLVLVVPLVSAVIIQLVTTINNTLQLHQQLRFELKQPIRSNDGKYSLESSINIIMSYHTRSVRMELPMKKVELPFLQAFNHDIRLIGKRLLKRFFKRWNQIKN